MKIKPALFRKILRHFATGVTIVTTRDAEGKPYGVTVNSFTSVSLDPLLVLVCLHNQVAGLNCFFESEVFAINILSTKQAHLSKHFARSGVDRTRYLNWRGALGVPLIRGCLACLECELETTYPGGDHTILIGRVAEGRLSREARDPLLFYGGQYQESGP